MATATTTALTGLSKLSREALLDVYRSLPAPASEEVAGEYGPWLPDYAVADFEAFLAVQNQDGWHGKAYALRPHESWPGQGYNLWQIGPDVVRSLRFAWRIGPSGLDGRPALVMDYSAFATPAGNWELVDELRRLDDAALLGIYSSREPIPLFTPVADPASGRTRHEIFGLCGPIADWVGPDDPVAELHPSATR